MAICCAIKSLFVWLSLLSNALAGNFTNDHSPALMEEKQDVSFASSDSSLVLNTNFASTSQHDAESVLSSENRIEGIGLHEKKFKLQNHAAKLMPEERVSTCMRYMSPNVEFVQIAKSFDGEHVGYRGLTRCGSVWMCPVCSARVTEQRKNELMIAISNTKYRLILVTYTLRHFEDDKLKDLLIALKEAFGKMRSGGVWDRFKLSIGIIGAILATEVTHGLENGWHPHRHELMFLPEGTDDETIKKLEAKLKQMWDKALRQVGYDASWERGVHVNSDENLRRDYIAKWGQEPKNQKWTTVHELVKAPSKKGHFKGRTPFQLLGLSMEGDKWAGELFQEYCAAFKGSKQLHYSTGLREILGLTPVDPDEDELANQELPEDTAPTLIELNDAQWWDVYHKGLRGKLLDNAKIMDKEKLWEWLMSMGVTRRYKYELVQWYERSRYLTAVKVYI